jgi:hypothetical protein
MDLVIDQSASHQHETTRHVLVLLDAAEPSTAALLRVQQWQK